MRHKLRTHEFLFNRTVSVGTMATESWPKLGVGQSCLRWYIQLRWNPNSISSNDSNRIEHGWKIPQSLIFPLNPAIFHSGFHGFHGGQRFSPTVIGWHPISQLLFRKPTKRLKSKILLKGWFICIYIYTHIHIYINIIMYIYMLSVWVVNIPHYNSL